MGQRHVRAFEAVNLNRVNGRVFGHARDGLMRAHVWRAVSEVQMQRGGPGARSGRVLWARRTSLLALTATANWVMVKKCEV